VLVKLDLSEILAHVGMRLSTAIDEPPIVDEDLECAENVKGKLEAANTGSLLLLNGSASTRVTLCCGKCLRYFDLPVEVQIEEPYPLKSAPQGRGGRRPSISVEEEETAEAGRLFDGPLLDLTELLRQSIMLELPSTPMHDPDCLGLCPECGGDLNESACGCRKSLGNYALRGLSKLMENPKT
jgi:uncharacterized protein